MRLVGGDFLFRINYERLMCCLILYIKYSFLKLARKNLGAVRDFL